MSYPINPNDVPVNLDFVNRSRVTMPVLRSSMRAAIFRRLVRLTGVFFGVAIVSTLIMLLFGWIVFLCIAAAAAIPARKFGVRHE